VSDEGSLVFTDFGWEFLEQMRQAGFADVALHIYWAESRGYLGVGQHYIRAVKSGRSYAERVGSELQSFNQVEVVHDLPAIFHYWSNQHLKPIFEDAGISTLVDFFSQQLAEAARDTGAQKPRFVSVGSGNCDFEISIAAKLAESGMKEFVIECLELNPQMLDRGRGHAESLGLGQYLAFVEADFNTWRTDGTYDAVMANQSLHHVLNLEGLFEQINAGLHDEGRFVVSDIIGRNGHMRWPEALEIVNDLWRQLPASHKYNHALKRSEEAYENWNCASEGFEGVRAQDILPLLLRRFHFERFVAFGNVIDIFTDRGFGPNFNPEAAQDRAFIDKVHAIDEEGFRTGKLTPTHLIGVLRKRPVSNPYYSRGLAPEQCVRIP
jgi:SAM-dependent methyltransferase